MAVIHTSRKLEKLIKKYIVYGVKGNPAKPLDSFYADVITIHRKRCWIVIHEPSLYCVLLPNMTGARAANAGQVLAKAMEEQWKYEGILPLEGDIPSDFQLGLMNPEATIQFAETNANRKTGGYLRDRIENLKARENDYPSFETYSFEHEGGVLNRIPTFDRTDESKPLVQAHSLMRKHLGLEVGDWINMREPFQGALKKGTPLTKEQRYQADMHYYDALESRTEVDFRQNLKRALAINPKHIASRLLLLEQRPPAKRVVELIELLEDAEQELGAQFKAFKGGFWGFPETRPYMRVRQELASVLHHLGKTEKAVNHWQAMLELNPNDNQGVRYELAREYLLAGRLSDFQQLYASYPDEMSGHWAWYSVLYGVLGEEHSVRLDPLVAEATQRNPHVMPLLKAGRIPEVKLPDTYQHGSPTEALLILDGMDKLLKDKRVRSWLKGLG